MITQGGNAELELVDSMDPFAEGIIFSVMPPKKSWKNISNLSGGEKTLSSLALVFALHVYKVRGEPALHRQHILTIPQPTPLYFMDEIDAIGGRRFSEGTSADREIQRTLMEVGFSIVGAHIRV